MCMEAPRAVCGTAGRGLENCSAAADGERCATPPVQALKGASGDLEVGELMSAAGGGSVGGEAEAPAEPGGGKALRRAADSSVAPVAAVEPNVPWLYQVGECLLGEC